MTHPPLYEVSWTCPLRSFMDVSLPGFGPIRNETIPRSGD